MVYDNRFIPLFQRTVIDVPGSMFRFTADPFFASSDSAYGTNEDEVGLPELCGIFDQGAFARSFEIAGLCNPMKQQRPEWVVGEIVLGSQGKLQIQGASFSYQYKLSDLVCIALYGMIMRVNSRQWFSLRSTDTNLMLRGDDILELDELRRAMFQTLGLSCAHSNQVGFGDIDLYVRLKHSWHYCYKMRNIEAGIRFGGLLATGKRRDICDPLSIPFGGNGHYGLYGALDAEAEIREDLFFGLLFRVQKRFTRTQIERLPVLQEPPIYGVVTGPVAVTPGVTVIFSPYCYIENIRNGLALGIRYTLTSHQQDIWCDKRSKAEQKAVPVAIDRVENCSSWASDYISLTAFYDFGKERTDRGCGGVESIISLTWDVPTVWFVAHNVSKTQKVTVGLSINF